MDMVHDVSSSLRHLLPIPLRWCQCQMLVNDYTRILALETPAQAGSSGLCGRKRRKIAEMKNEKRHEKVDGNGCGFGKSKIYFIKDSALGHLDS